MIALSMKNPQIVIVGAGLAGLMAAYSAEKAGCDYLLLERATKAGGNVQTSQIEGSLVEPGPLGFLASQYFLALCAELGLKPVLANNLAQKKFILHAGQVHEVSPQNLILGNLLSWEAKFACLGEFFRPEPNPPLTDESVGAFFARRFHPELAQKLVQAVLNGIHASNIYDLSLQACFPKLKETVLKHGSLIGAMFGKPPQKRLLLSFAGGMSDLVQALLARLNPARVRLGVGVQVIESASESYRVQLSSGEELEASKVIVATNASQAARLFPSQLSALAQIKYNKLTTVSFALDAITSKNQKYSQSFGVLASAGNLLGIRFDESIFTGLCGGTLFVGGTETGDSVNLAKRILESDFGMSGFRVLRQTPWPEAIPVFAVGHDKLIASVRSALGSKLALAGNYLRGISLEEALRSGEEAFELLRG